MNPDQAESLRRMVATANQPSSHQPDQGGLVLVADLIDPVRSALVAQSLALHLQRNGHDSALLAIHDLQRSEQLPWTTVERGTLDQIVRGEKLLREVWAHGPCGLHVLWPSRGHDQIELEDQHLERLLDQLAQAKQRRWVCVDVHSATEMSRLMPVADHCLFLTDAVLEHTVEAYRFIKRVARSLQDALCWHVVRDAADPAAAREVHSRLRITCDRHLNLALLHAASIPSVPMGSSDGQLDDSHAMRKKQETAAAHAVDELIERMTPKFRRTRRMALSEVAG